MARDQDFFTTSQLDLEIALTTVKDWIVRKWTATL